MVFRCDTIEVVPLGIFWLNLAGNSQTLAAAGATTGHNRATALGLHSCAKSVHLLMFSLIWRIGSLRHTRWYNFDSKSLPKL